MRNKIVAIQGNKLSKLNLTTDTSIFLAKEAQKIGLKLFYYEPQNLSIVKNKIIAQGNFIKFTDDKKFYKILDNKLLDLSTVKYILIRQDPPFNLEYITTTYILDNLNKVKIINNPSAIRNISEKLYSTRFMKYLPRTIFSSDIKQIKKFLKLNKKIIIKPIHGYSGNNIKLLNGKLNKKEIVNYLNKHGHIMCQKFLPLIKFGDKRVFIINGKIVGAISGVPKKGSFLSNLSKGASAKLIKLTKKELSISKIVAKDLKQNNIYFAGIDFISGKLNGDINVTSPTGLKTFFDFVLARPIDFISV